MRGPNPSGIPPLGTFSWHELATSDNEAAFAFYSGLFGWDAMTRMDMGPTGIYLVFGMNGVQRGGMYIKPPDWPAPPNWMPYAHVPSVDASAANLESVGATDPGRAHGRAGRQPHQPRSWIRRARRLRFIPSRPKPWRQSPRQSAKAEAKAPKAEAKAKPAAKPKAKLAVRAKAAKKQVKKKAKAARKTVKKVAQEGEPESGQGREERRKRRPKAK